MVLNIPLDIAIVGFYNNSISKIAEPKITTIRYPEIDMGKIVALIKHQ